MPMVSKMVSIGLQWEKHKTYTSLTLQNAFFHNANKFTFEDTSSSPEPKADW